MRRDPDTNRRLEGDRGAALVEAAIVLPFIILVVFGIVELGFLFRSAAVVNGSTRSGVRLAAANYGSASTGASQTSVIDNVRLTVEKDLSTRAAVDTPAYLWIYKSDASGNPPSGNFGTCGTPCWVYTWNAGTGHFQLASGAWASPVVCGTTHDAVGVYVRVRHAPIGFTSFMGTIDITEHSVMVIEPPNPNTCPQGS